MKYNIGSYVKLRVSPNDNYIVTHTKQNKESHDLLKEGGDYLIQKEWDYKTKSDVNGSSFILVFEEDIFS